MASANPTVASSSTPAAMDGGGDRKRKRRGEEGASSSPAAAAAKPSQSKWRTVSEQKTYSSKLLEALRRVRRASPASAQLPKNRAVHEAADRVLAVAARGRTRWSRAILASRTVKLRALRCRPAAPKPISGAGGAVAAAVARSSEVGRKMKKNKKKHQSIVEKKEKVLGRLVPGCRKLSFPTLLEEATDYIAALEMQVRAMSAIAEILSAAADQRTERAGLTEPM